MIIAFCLLGMAVGVFVMAAGVAKDEEQEDKFQPVPDVRQDSEHDKPANDNQA